MAIFLNKKTDRFFISINKLGPHSFILLGVYDGFAVKHILSRVGKFAFGEKDCISKIGCFDASRFIFRFFFTQNPSRLIDERKFNKSTHPISYQAYDITFEQYQEYVEILRTLQTQENKFTCYQPTWVRDDEIKMEDFEVAATADPQSCQYKTKAGSLNINNTCRHTAVELLEGVLHNPSSVSHNFFNDLAAETVLDRGIPSAAFSFYVLPEVPNAYSDLGNEKLTILHKLYQRMERMIALEPNSVKTQHKFTCLKNLYLEIAGPQKGLSLEDLLSNIKDWKSKNQQILAILRDTFVWDSFFHRKSSTIKMVEQIEKDLGQKIKMH